MWALGEAPTFLKRHEEILNEKIMAAGSKEAGRMPGVENYTGGGRKDHNARLRPPRSEFPSFAIFEDDTATDDHRGMLATATEPIPTGDAIAAVY